MAELVGSSPQAEQLKLKELGWTLVAVRVSFYCDGWIRRALLGRCCGLVHLEVSEDAFSCI